jgi:lipoic acid synthetase
VCPNIGDCFERRTATFLILGDTCTRQCGFCAVKKGAPSGPDDGEPLRIADAVRQMKLAYVVITSVTRDDLPDGGAAAYARTIRGIREINGGCRVEALIPDFGGYSESLETVLDARPDVINHNVETVPRLYSQVRPAADYRRSLELLKYAREKNPLLVTKSGLMVGLGETRGELYETMRAIRAAGCEVLTIGQYLSPSRNSLPVERYYAPEEFSALKDAGMRMGFRYMESGPLVRSSYHAEMQADHCRVRHG